MKDDEQAGGEICMVGGSICAGWEASARNGIWMRRMRGLGSVDGAKARDAVGRGCEVRGGGVGRMRGWGGILGGRAPQVASSARIGADGELKVGGNVSTRPGVLVALAVGDGASLKPGLCVEHRAGRDDSTQEACGSFGARTQI